MVEIFNSFLKLLDMWLRKAKPLITGSVKWEVEGMVVFPMMKLKQLDKGRNHVILFRERRLLLQLELPHIAINFFL